MKKFFIIILLFVFSNNIVFAGDENLGFRGPLNFAQCKILEHVVSCEIHKIMGGRARVRFVSYGAKALRRGIFKSAAMKGKDFNLDGINISKINIETITENNRLDVSDLNNVKLITDILAKYTAEITNDDIKTIIASRPYQNEIARINKRLAPFIRIYNSDVYCRNNRLFIKLFLASDLIGSKFTVSISTDIYSDGYKTGFDDIKLNKKLQMGLSDKIIEFIDALNPVNFVVKELDDAKISTTVRSINIVDDKIQISGIIKIYKDER